MKADVLVLLEGVCGGGVGVGVGGVDGGRQAIRAAFLRALYL